MELAKSQILKNALEEVKQRTGLDDNGIKQLFIKEYMLENEGKSANELFSEWIRKQAK